MRRGPTTVLRFNPSQLAVLTSQIGPNKTRPMTAAECMQAFPSALAIINGPMFTRCPEEPGMRPGQSQADWYSHLRCVVADYVQYDPVHDAELPGRSPNAGMTFSIVPNEVGSEVRVTRGASPDPDAGIAVQTYPSLVWDGGYPTLNGEGPNAQTVWRAALGATSDGNLCFIASQAPMISFAHECVYVGHARYAGYLDGGGSFELLMRSGWRIGHPEDRRVGTWLGVMEPSYLTTLSRYARVHPFRAGAIVAATAGLGFLGYKLATRNNPHEDRRTTHRKRS